MTGGRALLAALCLLAAPGAGRAINWEGHTDWMVDSPMSLELEREVIEANPRAWRGCLACGRPAPPEPSCPRASPGATGQPAPARCRPD